LIHRSYADGESIQLAVIIIMTSASSSYYYYFFFCPRYQLILGQTYDEMENGKLATHIYENFRQSSLIDQYPITW
jgi:hypothetical protein